MANILYIGDKYYGSTSAHRANALRRLGHNVFSSDPSEVFSNKFYKHLLYPIHYRTGFQFVQRAVLEWLSKEVKKVKNFDAVWVDSGELFGLECVKLLKSFQKPVILFNVDDPTGNRDGHRFDSLIKAIPKYDLIVVVREETEKECINLNAKKVLRLFRSYDEIAHRPYENLSEIPDKFRSEVAFIGTWMRQENRDEFLLKLLENGIPVSIWGDRWNKSKYWDKLKNVHRGGSLSGRDYVAAIQGADICLGLLSKGNRDLHTQRSLEVPFASGLFCAERTSEHMKLYEENKEAVFWQNELECIEVCKALLGNKEKREKIKINGKRKVEYLHVGNEDVCSNVLNALSIK